MPLFERGESDGAKITVEFEGGLSWMAHPEEDGQRSSHAIRTADGVWLLDPIDAPNVEERIASLGDVAGVAVLSCYHARDAEAFARRHDVPVSYPTWMSRIGDLVDAPTDQYTFSPAGEFRVLTCRPFPGWEEVFWYHGPSGTLVVPDSLGTIDSFCVGDERLGLELLRRLQPPTQLAGLDPERILVGHGPGVTDHAGSALREALDGARWTFPAALRENGVQSARSIFAAMRP
ncbi:hypothetical protein [Halovenus halobia]|uniref:hypothetical protein n=1 Tax=Halovenus halobia TaxID=3396622 RepID=UPI003F55335B